MWQRTWADRGRLAMGLVAVVAVAACGGGGEDKEDEAFAIGGTVTGLAGTVVLRNNGGDDLTLTTDGTFRFPTEVPRGAPYEVTVRTHPAGQTCTLGNASGITNVPVTDVLVSCASDPSFTVGGVVTGLTGTLVLRNGVENLTVTTNGTFTFIGRVSNGLTYAVSIATQPVGQTCTVINGSGTVAGANVTNVTVRCVTEVVSYSIGGNVSGLSGSLVLMNGTDELTVTSNGPFTFADRVADGLTYDVTVATQPAGQACTVSRGSGTVAGANVTDVAVSCSTVEQTYPIGGTVSGLAGGTLRLSLTHGGPATTIEVTSNGDYDFDPERVADGDSYVVSIAAQPAGQLCSLVNQSGTANGPVDDVDVTCSGITPTTFSVGGTISGLTGTGLEIEQGPSNRVSPTPGSTTFTLPVEYADGDVYDVGISAQPAGQTCVITRSHGRVDAADLTSIEVECIDNVTDPLVGTYAIPALLPDSMAYLTLFADGVYVFGGVEDDKDCKGGERGNGVEYGVYDYDASSGSLTFRSAVVDTNGRCGVWDAGSQFDGTLAVSGSGQDKVMTLTIAGGDQLDFVPVEATAGTLFGSFADPYHRSFWLFLSAGGDSVYFFNTQTQTDYGSTSLGFDAGVEFACGDIDGTTIIGRLDPEFDRDSCQIPFPDDDDPVDTNGTSGLSHLAAPWNFSVIVDTLTSSTFDGSRIVPN